MTCTLKPTLPIMNPDVLRTHRPPTYCRGVSAVSLSGDKGKRFAFPSGILGTRSTTPITCQAHSDHHVRYQGNDLWGEPLLHTNDDSADSGLYAYGYTNGTQLWVGFDVIPHDTTPFCEYFVWLVQYNVLFDLTCVCFFFRV